MSEQLQLLLVDDDEGVRRSLTMRLLLDSSINVVGEAADGESALALAVVLRPHVVLLDLNLPGMSGLEVCEALTGMQIPVVMFSLDDSDRTQLACLAARASSFVSKQAPANLLLAALHAARATPGDGGSVPRLDDTNKVVG